MDAKQVSHPKHPNFNTRRDVAQAGSVWENIRRRPNARQTDATIDKSLSFVKNRARVRSYVTATAMTPKVLTASEVASVCARLTSRPCSPRQVHYLLVGGGLGTDARRRRHGQTRVYGILDVAFVRLAFRLQAEGVSPMVARVTLTYLRNDLIRAWKAGAALALSIIGVHGALQPVLKTRPAAAVAYVPLLEIWRGLEAELHRVASARGEVWMWRHVPVNAVPRASA